VHYDIVVYGGTSSGIITAYTASKLGKSVVLIEPGNRLGGLSSGGLGQKEALWPRPVFLTRLEEKITQLITKLLTVFSLCTRINSLME